MAEHFKDTISTYLRGRLDNELGNSHEDLCMCESCQKPLSKWLKQKYKTIEALNEAWGNGILSQTYDSFNKSQHQSNPTQSVPAFELKRFCSDLVIDFCGMQVEIIKKLRRIRR